MAEVEEQIEAATNEAAEAEIEAVGGQQSDSRVASAKSSNVNIILRLLSSTIYFRVQLIFALTSTSTTWSDKLT